MENEFQILAEKIEAIRTKWGNRLCILGHFYQRPEILAHAEVVGDSFKLHRRAEEERAAMKKETQMQKAAVELQKRFGKNAVVKGMNLLPGGKTIERNGQVGGHKA